MKNYSELTDDVLVELTLLDDDQAYAELVNRYKKAVVGTAYKVTGNTFFAEDASQDAFVCAWMNLYALSDFTKFRSWICAIAKNCALRIISDYKCTIDTISLDTSLLNDDIPDYAWDGIEKTSEVTDAIEHLSDKIREAVVLHYIEGYTVSEIALRLSVSEGTVKWRLFEGRKQLRKGYGIMEDKYIENEELLDRVMRQVENLKLWQIKWDKTGFKEEYEKVLASLNSLPESEMKDSLMADAMMCNVMVNHNLDFDEIKRIKALAEKCRNEEVINKVFLFEAWEFILPYMDNMTDNDVYSLYIEALKKYSLPYLQKYKFNKAISCLYMRLAFYYQAMGDYKSQYESLKTALSYTSKDDSDYIFLNRAVKECDKLIENGTFDSYTENKHIFVGIFELKKIGGVYYFWSSSNQCIGANSISTPLGSDCFGVLNRLYCYDNNLLLIPKQVNYFNQSKQIESFIESNNDSITVNGTKYTDLVNIVRNEWLIYPKRFLNRTTTNSYFKKGVGLVFQKTSMDFASIQYSLVSSNVKPSDEYFPMNKGDKWLYRFENDYCNYIASDVEMEILDNDCDTVKILMTCVQNDLEIDTSPESILNYTTIMLSDKRYENYESSGKMLLEKAYSECTDRTLKKQIEYLRKYADKTAYSADTSNKNCREYALWNSLRVIDLKEEDGGISAFERFKYFIGDTRNGEALSTKCIESHKLWYADFIGILKDSFNKVWANEWKTGYSETIFKKIYNYDCEIRFHFVRDGETVVTPAGKFDNCLHIQIDVRNLPGVYMPFAYRGGWMDYWFAKGIGIVQYFHLINNEFDCYWVLTEYSGTGEGYFPINDALIRKYAPREIGDGCHSSLDMEIVADNDKTTMITLLTGTQDSDEFRKFDVKIRAENDATVNTVRENIEKAVKNV